MKLILLLVLALAVVGCSEPVSSYEQPPYAQYFGGRDTELERAVGRRGHDIFRLDRIGAKWAYDINGRITRKICVAYLPGGKWHECWVVIPERVETCEIGDDNIAICPGEKEGEILYGSPTSSRSGWVATSDE